MVFLLLMGLLISFGDKGLVDNYRLKENLTVLRSVNQQVIYKNKDLKKKILLLRNNLQYIEEAARSGLGMVKKGDVVYRFDCNCSDR